MGDSPSRLVPLSKSTTGSVGTAARIADVSPSTIVRWARAYGVGRQLSPGATWQISIPAVRMVRACDLEALEAYRQLDISSPLVAKYVKDALA